MKCLFCDKNEIKGTAKKFCSRKCKKLSQFKYTDLICEVCNVTKKIKRSRLNARFCSIKCKYIWWKTRVVSEYTRNKLSESLTGLPKSEEHRKKITERFRTNIKYGKEHPAWRGGMKIGLAIRTSKQNVRWREAVFKRDNYTCQLCRIRGVYIEADHIKPLSIIVRENNITSMDDARKCELLWNIDNGRTLCKECHSKTDTFKGKCRTYEKKLFNTTSESIK